MRRRLHALYASAQVFRVHDLARSLKECIRLLDTARDEDRAITSAEIEQLATLARELPSLAGEAALSNAPSGRSWMPPSPSAMGAMMQQADVAQYSEAPQPFRIPQPFQEPKGGRPEQAGAGSDEAMQDSAALEAPVAEDELGSGGIEAQALAGSSRRPAAKVHPEQFAAAKASLGRREAGALNLTRSESADSSLDAASLDLPFAGLDRQTSQDEVAAAQERLSFSDAPERSHRQGDEANAELWSSLPSLDAPGEAPGGGRSLRESRRSEPQLPEAGQVIAPSPAATAPSADDDAPISDRMQAQTALPPAGYPGTSAPPVVTVALRPQRSAVLAVLILDRDEVTERARADLSEEGFEVLGAHGIDEALALVRASSPDAVLVGLGSAREQDARLIRELKEDSWTDSIPILLLHDAVDELVARAAREELDADDILARPVDPAALMDRLIDLAGARKVLPPSTLGEMTLEEVAERLASEIRRGLVETADEGKELKIPIGDGSEVLAAAWAAIAKVRTHLVERAEGKVSFRGDAPGSPQVVSVGEVSPSQTADAAESSSARRVQKEEGVLEGWRILVVDDDPAVRWFFVGLLREAGAIADEAEDGLAAVAAARRSRPDVILSDILMPKMDGLALCREVARDPALVETPVILLSWKEDFLQRMRELQAGAQGYLRKEAGSAQILERVLDALAPRLSLRERLSADGEVGGAIEGIGVAAIFDDVVTARPDCRIIFRDSWSLVEVDLHGGALGAVTRTAADGAFSRGDDALALLVGMRSGRFKVVATVEGSHRRPTRDLRRSVADSVLRTAALIDAVTGDALIEVASIEFDGSALQSFLATAALETRAIFADVDFGADTPTLSLEGVARTEGLEAVLATCARKGIVRGISGWEGEDRIAEALRARQTGRGLISRPPPPLTTATMEDSSTTTTLASQSRWAQPSEVDAELDEFLEVGTGEMLATDADALALRSRPPTIPPAVRPASAEPPSAVASTPSEGQASSDASLQHQGSDAIEANASGEVSVEVAAEPDANVGSDALLQETSSGFVEVGVEPADEMALDVAGGGEEPVAPSTGDAALPDNAVETPNRQDGPAEETPWTSVSEAVHDEDEPTTGSGRLSGTVTDAYRALGSIPPGPAPSANRLRPLFWIAAIALMVVLGFVLIRVVDHLSRAGESSVELEVAAPERLDQLALVDGDRENTEASASTAAKRPTLDERLSFGESRPGTNDSGIEVASGQGVLQVEGGDVQIDIGQRSLGSPPVSVALPEGRHELAIRRGGRTSFRFVHVRAGHTRTVRFLE